MSIVWDPRTVLGIFREDETFTCVGTTQRGSRCKQAMFSGGDRSQARQILDTMASRHPSSQAVRDKLSDLASLTLCPRWHRKPGYCQMTQMVQKWQRLIENYCNTFPPDVPATIPRAHRDRAANPVSSTAARTSEAIRVRRSPSPDSDSDAAVREIRVPRSRRRPTILTPQPTVPSTPPTPTTPTSSRPATPSTPFVLFTPPPSPTRQHSRSAATTSPPSSTNSPPANDQNNTTTTIPPPTPPASSTPPFSPPPTPCPAPHRVRRKPIDEDCAVCQEPICCPDDAVWCRAQCGQNTHRECFAEWRRTSLRLARENRMDDDPAEEDRLDAVKCVFCRAVWKWEWQD